MDEIIRPDFKGYVWIVSSKEKRIIFSVKKTFIRYAWITKLGSLRIIWSISNTCYT